MLIAIGVLCLMLAAILIPAALFHLMTLKDKAAPQPEALPAKRISKQEAWSPPAYDYGRMSVADAAAPVEPGDPDPPEPYE